MSNIRRTLDPEQIKDVRNARVVRRSMASTFEALRLPVAELQRLTGQPQFKELDAKPTRSLFDEEGDEQ